MYQTVIIYTCITSNRLTILVLLLHWINVKWEEFEDTKGAAI